MKINDYVIFSFVIFLTCFLFISLSNYRHQQAKIYELEQRIFYLEDTAMLWIYGPINMEDNEVDFDNY